MDQRLHQSCSGHGETHQGALSSPVAFRQRVQAPRVRFTRPTAFHAAPSAAGCVVASDRARDAEMARACRLPSAFGRSRRHERNSVEHQDNQACIDACNDCAVACSSCATACLREDDVKAMARCIALDIDCAAICQLAAAAIARESELSGEISALCATICDACGDECARHDMVHCQKCAEACRRCAEECRRMAA